MVCHSYPKSTNPIDGFEQIICICHNPSYEGEERLVAVLKEFKEQMRKKF